MAASAYDTIGKPVGRAEGPEKVSGKALYAADVKLEGTLVGKCLRSPYPYARIVSVDTDEAKKVAGVHAVITAGDIVNARVGRMLRDMPILADGVVRFVGQKVAAVAADDIDAAEEALALIEVQYEELEPVFDPVAATTDGAPVLHPDFAEYEGRVDAPQEHPNVVAHASWGKGDVDVGFEQADLIFEHTFTTQHQHQGYIETHAVTLMIGDDGRVQVWVNCKMPFQVRKQLADGIGLAEDQVVFNAAVIGGDFGGKGGFMDTHVAYYLAKATQRPIRMTMSYTEELMAGNPRHPAVMTVKTGVKRDGTIVARHAKLVFNSGAYGAFKPGRGVTYGPRCLGPYKMEHARIDSYMVYTNQVPCGSMRSPGDPQSVFACEADIDLVARELEIDPLEFRMKNMMGEGDESPIGRRWENITAPRILEACAREAGILDARREVLGKRVGRGLAICERPTGGGASTAKVSIDAQGAVTLHTSLRDTGSGFYTMMRQVVGKELGVAYDQIAMETWTTDALAFDGGVGGARVTNTGGNAALGAARKVKEILSGLAANKFGWAVDEIEFADERVSSSDASVSLAELVAGYGDDVAAEYQHEAPPNPASTVFSAQAAEVEIDEETGEITLTQITSAHDVGTIINPISHQGQIDGSVMQGVGAALIEGLQYDDGHVINQNLGDYKLPVMKDIPRLKTVHVVDVHEGPTPYGGKAIGEQAISAVAPAIINAILDATGISMRRLPVTSEAMLAALENRG
ncbi:MAG: xanthine dehydrogenase family protein molybdopterin-binding subunit [Pseudomonadales bacterium]